MRINKKLVIYFPMYVSNGIIKIIRFQKIIQPIRENLDFS